MDTKAAALSVELERVATALEAAARETSTLVRYISTETDKAELVAAVLAKQPHESPQHDLLSQQLEKITVDNAKAEASFTEQVAAIRALDEQRKSLVAALASIGRPFDQRQLKKQEKHAHVPLKSYDRKRAMTSKDKATFQKDLETAVKRKVDAAAAEATDIAKRNETMQRLQGSQKPQEQKQPHLSQEESGTGWMMAVDPASGKPYYYNPNTGETAWELQQEPQEKHKHVKDQHQEQDQPQQHRQESGTGWMVAVDPASGKPYYYNPNTGETAWELQQEPQEEQKHVKDQYQEQDQPQQHRQESGTGWMMAVDPASGKPYYYNPNTGETAWELRQEPQEEQKHVKDQYQEQDQPQQHRQESGTGWMMAVDPASGKPYYYNPNTGETAWELQQEPQEEQKHVKDQYQEQDQPQQHRQESGTGWMMAVDPASGKPYYYNPKTGETAWELQQEPQTQPNHLQAQYQEQEQPQQHQQVSDSNNRV